MRTIIGTLALAASLAACAAPAGACAAGAHCAVSGGHYIYRLPAGWDGKEKLRSVVFFHGWQGTADAIIADQSLGALLDREKILLVAPQGEGKTWSFPGSPGRHRDEFAFVGAVLDDALARLPIDPERLIASGFSQGGSMVWNLACHMAPRFSAFAPIAGAFWRPHPERCTSGPVLIRHVHGTSDTTVPMQGRALRGGLFRQGDVREGWQLLIAANACANAPAKRETKANMVCETWTDCGNGRAMALCLHPGGHEMERTWLAEAFDWLEQNRVNR
jgi:polyhydroxybutyrate depolymerase